MLNWLKQQIQIFKPSSDTDLVQIDFSALKEILDYEFKNSDLFIQALKHRSFLPVNQEKRIQSNERLELLGDAVLDLVVIEFLYHHFPDKDEGEITNMKSLLVSRKVLARVARALRLGDFILLSESEERSGGRKRASINADALEAIIGAIYLDGGLAW
jgi:ribonuclease-3